VFALNLILYKHVEVAIKLLHQKSRNQTFEMQQKLENHERSNQQLINYAA